MYVTEIRIFNTTEWTFSTQLNKGKWAKSSNTTSVTLHLVKQTPHLYWKVLATVREALTLGALVPVLKSGSCSSMEIAELLMF